MSKKVLVPIADGTEELEAVAIIDILRRAGAEVVVASVGVEGLQVTASRGVKITADREINSCVNETFDLIALPGGIPGAEHLRDSVSLVQLLKRQQQEGRSIGAICAAPVVVLQHHNLIGGRKATCHPSRKEALFNPEAAHQRVVVDGTLITSQAPGTAIEFALKLVELLFGPQKAGEVAGPLAI